MRLYAVTQILNEREIRALQLWNDALNSSAAGDFDIAALAKTLGAEGKVVTAVENRVADEANSLEHELKSGREASKARRPVRC